MIVVMEAGHLHELERTYPESIGRCFLLSRFSGDLEGWGNHYARYNIPDPFGKREEQFVRCYERIDICVGNLLTGMETK